MKHALISLLLVFAATHACAQVDPVRQQVTFRPVTTQTDEDGDINRLFITYVTPDGMENALVCEMPWPVSPDMFIGGTIEEVDLNFDGNLDFMVFLAYTDGTGHNPVYEPYIWDVKTHSFISIPDSPNFVSPFVMPEEKCIVIREITENIADYYKYVWKDGKLVNTDKWQDDLNELGKE